MYADGTNLTYADKNLNIIQSCLNEDLTSESRTLLYVLISSLLSFRRVNISQVIWESIISQSALSIILF